MPVIGLTGNYGMGKSTVLRLFKEAGAITLDLDEVVDGLLTEGSVIEGIREIFGDIVFSGRELNKAKIAEIVFSDRDRRERLEGLLHPLVMERMREFLSKIDKSRVVIIEIPLLFEKGFEREFDKTITVYADRETAIKRLRDKGVGMDDALRRLQAQMPVEEKIKRSDFVINNNGTVEETRQQVFNIWDRVRIC